MGTKIFETALVVVDVRCETILLHYKLVPSSGFENTRLFLQHRYVCSKPTRSKWNLSCSAFP